jgi:hypothetical protein
VWRGRRRRAAGSRDTEHHISSFFPVCADGEEGIVVPRLNLDDVGSDVTLPCQSMDTSLPSQAEPGAWTNLSRLSPTSEPAGLETSRWGREAAERSASQRSIACDTTGLGLTSKSR